MASQSVALAVQGLIGLAAGAPLFLAMEGESFAARLQGSVLVGLGAMWLAMKLYVLLRHGRGAKVRFGEITEEDRRAPPDPRP